MNKTRFRFKAACALMVMLALVLGLAFGTLTVSRRVSALDYSATELFSSDTNGSVGTNKPASGASDSADYFIQFTFNAAEGKVHYRRDLALKWFAPIEDAEEGSEEGDAEGASLGLANPALEKFYSMTFSFPEINFTRFSLVYESAEENITKDGKATNTLVFFNDGGLKAAVRNSSEQPSKEVKNGDKEDTWFDSAEKTEIDGSGDITVTFDAEGCGSGEFNVKLNGVLVGQFTNVGGYFMEYLSSASSTPRDPITFTVDGLSEGKTEQLLLMKELNGQSFKINSVGRVDDNADPVLVVNEAVYAYTLGRKWSLTYEAIDVCDTSVSVTRRYVMIGAPEDGKYPMPTESEYKLDKNKLTTSTVFMPTNDSAEETQYVSIYFELDDGRQLASDTEEANRLREAKHIFLTWYAADEKQIATLDAADMYECSICKKLYSSAEYNEEGFTKCTNTEAAAHKEQGDALKESGFTVVSGKQFDCILVNRGDVALGGEKSGPKYVGVTANDETKTNETSAISEELAQKYQQAIDEIAYDKDTKELKLSAGEGSYFYLPSLRGLIASDNADYRNLRFSIYYKKGSLEVGESAASSTSLRYNALRFEIEEVGAYSFKVLASDAAGNAMKYYVDGKLVTVSSTNIWQIDAIPEFKFEVTYTGATIEDPGVQTQGYRDRSYTITSFDIVALEGYQSEYKLYRFEESNLAPGDVKPEYEDFYKNSKQYVEKYLAYTSDKKPLVEINKFNSDVTEDDKDRWDRTDNDYHWDPDNSLSFIPQEANTYYVVELTITENDCMPGNSVTAYQIIDVKNPIDPRPNPTYWLESNITSVVLFSISAVLLIIIVVLFVVKPSDKKLEDVDVETLRGNKKKKE